MDRSHWDSVEGGGGEEGSVEPSMEQRENLATDGSAIRGPNRRTNGIA